jgi:hypothetical protein
MTYTFWLFPHKKICLYHVFHLPSTEWLLNVRMCLDMVTLLRCFIEKVRHLSMCCFIL